MDTPRTFKDWEIVTQCPVCHSTKMSLLFPDTVSQCKNCDVIFRSRRPTQNAIQQSYDSDQTFTSWESERPAREQSWRRRIKAIQKFKTGGVLLDIGTGDGHFLEVARSAGFTCEGTEFSTAGRNRAASLGFEIHFGQLLDLKLPPESYDVVTIWHVLEHVPNPGAVLEEMKRILKPGGIAVVAVPNEENKLFRWRLRKNSQNPLGEPAWGEEIHLTHFQPSTLRNAMARAGLDVRHFGVDDIYASRTLRNIGVIKTHKLLSLLTGWHFSLAMLCIGQRKR